MIENSVAYRRAFLIPRSVARIRHLANRPLVQAEMAVLWRRFRVNATLRPRVAALRERIESLKAVAYRLRENRNTPTLRGVLDEIASLQTEIDAIDKAFEVER